MKFLVLLLAIGCVAASSVDVVLDRAAENVVEAFKQGFDEVPFIQGEADDAVEKTRSEFVSALQAALKETIEKVKVRVDDQHKKAQDLVEKVGELSDRLKEAGARAGEGVKNSIQSLGDSLRERIQKIIDRIGGDKREKRDVEDAVIQEMLLKPLIQQVKEKLKQRMNPANVRDWITKMVGSGEGKSEGLLATIREKGREALMKVIDNVMSAGKGRETRQISDMRETISGFLKDLGVNFRDRYADFADWLKGSWKSGIEKAKDQHERLKEIAKEVTSHAKDMQKETLKEAVEVLRPFREELGSLWGDLRDAAKRALGKEQ